MKQNLATQLAMGFNLVARPVIGAELRRISQKWLETFCPNVRRKTGKWVFQGYRWHAYSFGHEAALVGEQAFQAYRSMPSERFYLHFETDDLLFDCDATTWPDLRPLEDDIYVFPYSMHWTFVVTHELSIKLGPYFAEPTPEP